MNTVKPTEWLNLRGETRIILIEPDVTKHNAAEDPVLNRLVDLMLKYSWRCLPVFASTNERYLNSLPDADTWRVLTAQADGCVVNNYSGNISFECYLILATLWQKNIPVLIFGDPLHDFIPYSRLAVLSDMLSFEDVLTRYKHSRSMPDYKLRIDFAMQEYKI